MFVIYLWTTKSFKQPVQEEKLTTEEEDQLIEEWAPEPLVPTISEADKIREIKYLVEGTSFGISLLCFYDTYETQDQ